MTKMDNNLWLEIEDHYKIAKKCLWGSETSGDWQRDEDQGKFHLWQAYYKAVNEEEKKPLLYARILLMMAHEQNHVTSYVRFNKYIAPAKEAYDQAIELGMQPADKELARVRSWYESLKYELEKTADTPEQTEQAYSLIPELNDIPEFAFHDSKPVHFEHNEKNARLSLKFHDITVTFEFTDLIDLQISCDPLTNWIVDFYCYRFLHAPGTIMFDIGSYKIMCKSISVVNIIRDL